MLKSDQIKMIVGLNNQKDIVILNFKCLSKKFTDPQGEVYKCKVIVWYILFFSSVQSVVSNSLRHYEGNLPGLTVHHQLPEFTQTHVDWVGNAIQPSNPLSYPSTLAFNLSHHQGLFKWVSSSHQVAKVLESQLQHQSFQWIFRTDFLQDGLVGSPCSPRDSQESSPTPQFRGINSSVLNFLDSPTLASIHDHWKNHSCD